MNKTSIDKTGIDKIGHDRPHQARKRFGQNFLHDPLILHRMVEAIAPQTDDVVVEIGPGKGALTFPLLERLDHLIAIELDRDLIPLLQQSAADNVLELIQADALQLNFHDIKKADKKLRIVGNLPYNISTPILFHLASFSEIIEDVHVLLQKEVADRIHAPPGSKTYGRLSVMMQYHFDTSLLFNVGAGAFTPAPKVESTFIRLSPHSAPVADINRPELLSQVVSAAFSQRRKTLRNSLKEFLTAEQIQQANIDPSRRAETLSLQVCLAASRVRRPPARSSRT